MEKSGVFTINSEKEPRFLMPLQLDSMLNLRRFFFRGKGKKRTPDTFTSRVVCRPLTKVSVNICVIVMCHILTEIQAVCIEMIIYPRYR